MLKGQTIALSNGMVLELGKPIYHQHSLIGRGTWVLSKVEETEQVWRVQRRRWSMESGSHCQVELVTKVPQI